MDAAGVRERLLRKTGRPGVRQPLEKTIVARGIAVGRQLGWYAIKIHGGPFQLAGLPDVLFLKDGHAAWAEFKRPGCEPTKIQRHRMRELSEAGCSVQTCFSAADVRTFLESR